MRSLYKHHDPDEYSRIKNIVFSYSVVKDAIKMVHAAIEKQIASYLNKVHTGEYKNLSLRDTNEIDIISLWTRAKTALINRKVVGRKTLKKKLKPPIKDVIKEFEDNLRAPDENMHYPDH